jgi:diguanylate cyclase (GGDEF)-like protein/PAS domain S-box-containing protein
VKLKIVPRVIVLSVLASLVATSALAASGAAEAPFRFYTVLDGLTQSNVVDIEQDQAGYLWFTTARGLNRYDGKDFEQYTIADGLPNNSLTALYVGEDNWVWVGDAHGGVAAIHGARVIHTIAPLNDLDNPVLDIEFIGDRKLAVVEGIGIAEIVQDGAQYRLEYLAGESTTGITNLSIHGDDVWVESTTGLYRFALEPLQALELLAESVRKIHVDSSGALWTAEEGGRVGIWQGDTIVPVVTIESENPIVSLVTDSDGLIWAATRNELINVETHSSPSEYIGANVRRYAGADDVTSMFVDRENSIWLSSGSRLIRFLGDRFQHYRLRTEFDSETVWAISEDRLGRFWFGTESKLILRNHDESLVVVGADHGIPSATVRDMVADETGHLWIGITGHGLYRFDIDTMQGKHVSSSGKANILDVDIASDGAVWYSTIGSGVYRYQPGIEKLSKFDAPEDTSVYSLDVGDDGTVWYGADEVGIVRLLPNNDGSFDQTIIGSAGNTAEVIYEFVRMIRAEEGGFDTELLDSRAGLPKRLFNHISVTGPDSAWVVTEEGGLYHFEDNRFTDYGEATPLADQTVYLVQPLENGTVVVGGEQGLYQFVPGVPGVAHYNQQVGFIGLETNVHATFVDSDNKLWIGTVDGATRMDTSQPMPRLIEPTPTIVRVETQLSGYQVLDGEEIRPGELGARIEYAAISLLSPRGMQYSYKLDGVDSHWGSPTTSRSVGYPRIPPGSYEFMVRARYPGGGWSTEVAAYRFTILPFFWQRGWFIISVILAVVLALRAFMAYRTRSIQWLNDTLRAQVEERTESIENARKELELSNKKLSKEIEARAEVETRFSNAFENAPIGMGLLDANGVLFDANPALKNMLWPALLNRKFADAIGEEDRERFEEQYEVVVKTELSSLHQKLVCVAATGNEIQVVVNLSVVASESGDFLYSVLQVQDVTESMKLTDQLEYQASYDELTGLLNRRAFETQLERAWQETADDKNKSYLMFMDLDQFKVVNDTSGHTAGDQLLRAVSEILKDSVRNDDIVGRLGGDEFAIILWECPTEVAKRIAESIRQSIEDFRFHWDVETYRIGVSIGGLPIDPDVGDISELQQLADAACYAAKEAGRNRVHMVSGEKDSARAHRGQVRWVQRLREAMDKNRFAIYAQQIKPVDESVDEPESLEILLRLRDPETRKLIPPGAFLPAAERYGMSIELDKWVVTSLFNMLFVHHAFEAAHRKYWINLSGSSVGDRRFADFLIEAVTKSPLPRGTINFEITENAVTRNIAEAGELIASLRDMGCQFALDDFGSGLSSYSYLKKLPVDFVKIDGSFIRDLMRDETDRIFVKSIIDIAHALEIKAVAEFVENEEILDVVRELGADYVQGFMSGKPFVFAPSFLKSSDIDGDLTDVRERAG